MEARITALPLAPARRQPAAMRMLLRRACMQCAVHGELQRALWPEGRFTRYLRRSHSQEKKNMQGRSEEHTSELQSHSDLVCRLLLEKKKKKVTLSTPHDAPRFPASPANSDRTVSSSAQS